MENSIDRLKEIIDKSKYIVFFGGAGVSTESGVPDFRSVDGLYNQSYMYSPETILSHTFFIRNTEEFFRFYKDKMLFPIRDKTNDEIMTIDKNVHLDKVIEPNNAHKSLAKLEEIGKLKAIVTQNIDGLHQAAGSKAVYELHGSIHRNYCMKCHKFYDFKYVYNCQGVPRCQCGGVIKPDVVLYEESLDDKIVNDSIGHISNADTLIIGGTSLAVYPAAGLLQYFKGTNLVLINKSSTPMDDKADLVINDSIGEVLSKIVLERN